MTLDDLDADDACTCSPTDTLLDATLLMRERGAAFVLVVDAAAVVGIATQSAVLREAHAGGLGSSIACAMSPARESP